jgi:hypothetical protein
VTGEDEPVRTITPTNPDDIANLSLHQGTLAVVTYGGTRVDFYPADADGVTAPVRSIVGAATQITSPSSVRVANDGTVLVTTYEDEVLVFAPGANGNVAPRQRIAGGLTTLHYAEDAALDAAGRIHVANAETNVVSVFAAGANGNVAPIRSYWSSLVSDPFVYPSRLFIDARQNVYVSDYNAETIFLFPATASGAVVPTRTIGGAGSGIDGPWGLSLDSQRRIYNGNYGAGTVTVHAPLVPIARPTAVRSLAVSGKKKAVARTVSWAVPADDGDAALTYEVVVKKGKRTLLRRTTSRTSLRVTRVNLRSGKHSVTVTASNVDGAAPSVSSTFAVAKIAPGKVRAVQVKGKKGAPKRTVRWAEPAWDGGAKITGYRVVVRKGRAALVERTVKAKKRSVRFDRSALAGGKHKVSVKAVNKKGVGKAGKATFRVKG